MINMETLYTIKNEKNETVHICSTLKMAQFLVKPKQRIVQSDINEPWVKTLTTHKTNEVNTLNYQNLQKKQKHPIKPHTNGLRTAKSQVQNKDNQAAYTYPIQLFRKWD